MTQALQGSLSEPERQEPRAGTPESITQSRETQDLAAEQSNRVDMGVSQKVAKDGMGEKQRRGVLAKHGGLRFHWLTSKGESKDVESRLQSGRPWSLEHKRYIRAKMTSSLESPTAADPTTKRMSAFSRCRMKARIDER
jgi:hypothetical protein